MPIYSNQVETHVLGGLLKHPHVFPEIDSFVNVGDFYNEVHQSVFCVLRDAVLNGEKVDRVLVGTKISNLGNSFLHGAHQVAQKFSSVNFDEKSLKIILFPFLFINSRSGKSFGFS